MKTYATLQVDKEKFELFDEDKYTITKGIAPSIAYVFNLLSQMGYNYEFPLIYNTNWSVVMEIKSIDGDN